VLSLLGMHWSWGSYLQPPLVTFKLPFPEQLYAVVGFLLPYFLSKHQGCPSSHEHLANGRHRFFRDTGSWPLVDLLPLLQGIDAFMRFPVVDSGQVPVTGAFFREQALLLEELEPKT